MAKIQVDITQENNVAERRLYEVEQRTLGRTSTKQKEKTFRILKMVKLKLTE